MAYITPDVLQEDWNAVGSWADGDTFGGVSEIDPAGQLHLDLISVTENGSAVRTQDIGTIGSGDYYVEVKFIGDAWDGHGTAGITQGIHLSISGASQQLYIGIGNGFEGLGDGIVMSNASTLSLVHSETWDNAWHTVVFYVHNSQTDCDIWVDTDPAGAATVTDAACAEGAGDDGAISVVGWGSVAGNGEYHIDYLYIDLATIDYSMSVTVGAFTLTGIVAALKRGYTLAASVGSFVLTGISAVFNKALTMAAAAGTFTLTGITTTFTKGITIAVSVGSFVLTGIAAALSRIGWINQVRSDSIDPTNTAKNDISPTNITKTDISPANLAKTAISPANLAKSTAIDPTNSAKTDISPANTAKSSDISPANLTKTNISPANTAKTDISPTNQAKTDISPANLTKNNSSFRNRGKT